MRVASPANFSTDLAGQPIVASGKVTQLKHQYRYPVTPPRDWFARRIYKEATPVERTSDGHVFGHLWDWNVPHIGMVDGMRRKVYAPRARDNYASFMNKHVECDDGAFVKTGVIYIDTDHADLTLSGAEAQAAMAHTGTAVVDCCIYEDEFGGQIAGALRPQATPAQVRVFDGSDVSPDWRMTQGAYVMYGAISVNTTGLPVAATIAASGAVQPVRVADGRPRVLWDETQEEPVPLAMVAVGMVRHAPPEPLDKVYGLLAEQGALLAEIRGERAMSRFESSGAWKEFAAREQAVADRAEALLSGR